MELRNVFTESVFIFWLVTGGCAGIWLTTLTRQPVFSMFFGMIAGPIAVIVVAVITVVIHAVYTHIKKRGLGPPG
jgi:hypothetical protein